MCFVLFILLKEKEASAVEHIAMVDGNSSGVPSPIKL